ncbi:MAG: hypothetical protein AAGB04_10125 [Pseudomonadota bacterium]
MVDVRSPLEHCKSPLLVRGSTEADASPLKIRHESIGSLVQVAGWGTAFAEAVAPLLRELGLDNVGDFKQAQKSENTVSFRVAPQRLLLWTKDSQVAPASLSELDPASAPVLDLSHSRVCVTIEGSLARDYLARLCTIDLRLQSLPIGAFAQTTIHHTAALIFHSQTNHYVLLLPSSYAQSLWDYMALTAEPFEIIEATA